MQSNGYPMIPFLYQKAIYAYTHPENFWKDKHETVIGWAGVRKLYCMLSGKV